MDERGRDSRRCRWATLREVVAGRPFYRLPKPFPVEGRNGGDEALWMLAEARDPRRSVLPAHARRVAKALVARGHVVITVEFDTVTAFEAGLRCWSHPLARWD